jgi:AraC family transcriptional regulator of adaptative response/methylated-DNA-[protein]-cysteine methyltransferase
MRRAFRRKDTAFDGTFIVAVKTTGVFCRPVCRAKPPLPQNVEFFASADEALRNGYRPCKLCRPTQDRPAPPQVVAKLIELIDQSECQRVRESDMKAIGIDPSTARRQFRQYCGMTFAAYQRSRRLGQALSEVRSGAPVAMAQAGAGFESGSGFRQAFERMFGAPASAARANGVSTLTANWIETPLGRMVAVAQADGIALLDFIDRKGLPAAIQRLTERHRAAIAPGEHPHLAQLKRELDEYFRGTRREFAVSLAPNGSAFERRAWDYLRQIPFGQTRSYGQQASAIGATSGARAVGRANGMNYLSIVIPCHRVVASNGDLTGYGGGLARKRWLLDHEQRMSLRALRERETVSPSTTA